MPKGKHPCWMRAVASRSRRFLWRLAAFVVCHVLLKRLSSFPLPDGRTCPGHRVVYCSPRQQEEIHRLQLCEAPKTPNAICYRLDALTALLSVGCGHVVWEGGVRADTLWLNPQTACDDLLWLLQPQLALRECHTFLPYAKAPRKGKNNSEGRFRSVSNMKRELSAQRLPRPRNLYAVPAP